MRNAAPKILFQYRSFLTPSERRFLASVSPYYRLTWAQDDVVNTIYRRAKRRYKSGY